MDVSQVLNPGYALVLNNVIFDFSFDFVQLRISRNCSFYLKLENFFHAGWKSWEENNNISGILSLVLDILCTYIALFNSYNHEVWYII